MRLVRFAVKRSIKYGIIKKDTVVSLKGNPFNNTKIPLDSFPLDGESYPLNEVRLLSPCVPSKIICLGLNYMAHAKEIKSPPPPLPLLFMKPSTAVIGPDEDIILPRNYTRVDYEAELAVVIGKPAKYVPEDKVNEHIFGYTCFNDVTERDNQVADGQWTRAKSYDTFAPLGPHIETEIDASDLKIELYLNAVCKQSSRTGDLIFKIPRLVSFISGVMTLLPGDVIATGTPFGISPIKPGDVVEVKIENLGTLRNTVVAPR